MIVQILIFFLAQLVENVVDHILTTGKVTINLYEVKTYDNYTYIHSIDTSIMAIFLGLCLGFDKNKLINLGTAGLLHDIGKINIQNQLINKPIKLTNDEYEIIKRHSEDGKNILEKTNLVIVSTGT